MEKGAASMAGSALVISTSMLIRGLLADSLARYVGDLGTVDAEIGEFAVGHAAEFIDGLTVFAPIGEGAGDIHDHFLLVCLARDDCVPQFHELQIMMRCTNSKRRSCNAPMRQTHIVVSTIWKN
jgi:hypothetical protein